MKNFAFFLLFLSLFSIATASTWNREILVEGKQFFLDKEGLQSDTNGNLHLAYGGTGVYYGFFDGQNWQTETVVKTEKYTQSTMLQVNSSDIPIIVFFDQDTESLKMAEKILGNWHISTLVPCFYHFVDFTMKIDENDILHITLGSEYTLHYLTYSAESVTSEEIPGEHEYVHHNLMLEFRNPNTIIIVNYHTIYSLKNGDWINEQHYEYNPRSDSVLDSNQDLCIAYLDPNYRAPDLIALQRKSITGWSEEVIEYKFVSNYLTSASQSQSRLLVHPEFGLCFVYKHPENDLKNTLNVSSKTGALWQNEVIYESQSVLDYSCSAVFSKDDLHVVTYDAAKGAMLHIFKAGDQWDHSIIDEEIVLNDFNTFRLGTDGSRHFTYFNSVENSLVYLKNEASSLIFDVVDTMDIPGRALVSLELHSNNQPRICIYNPANEEFRYYSKMNETWEIETLAWMDEPVNSFDLAISSTDQPHLVIQNSSKFFLATYENDDWIVTDVTLQAYSHSFLGPIEIAVDGNDHVYCCQTRRSGSYRYGFSFIGTFVKVYPDFEVLYKGDYFYGEQTSEVLKGVPMANDRFGGVHASTTSMKQLGCHWEDCWDYFHHNGYPSGNYLGNSPRQTGPHDIACDSNGIPVELTSLMSLSRTNTLAFNRDDYKNYCTWSSIQLESDGKYNNIELQLDSRDYPHISHIWYGDLALTHQTEYLVDLQLAMPNYYFAPGDICKLELSIKNNGEHLSGIPLWCIAEIGGEFLFWPTWECEPDYKVINISSDETIIELLREFKWPLDSTEAVNTVTFYAGLLNDSQDSFLEHSSGPETWTFNYGPTL